MTDQVRQVSELIHRGPRPVSEADVRWLRDALGVRRVVNLQGFVAEYLQVHVERVWAQAAEVEFVHLPWNLVTPPSSDDVKAVLEAVRPAPPVPVYLHCHDGVDRTGVACLTYRLSCGWSFGRAVGEMIDDGFHLSHYFWWLPALQKLAQP